MPPRTSSPQTPPLTDQPLRRDVRTLGFELGHTLRDLAGDDLYHLVEQVRHLAKQRRLGDADADGQLRDRLAGMTLDELGDLIRANASFFDLANLAEDRHRVRVLRRRELEEHPDPRRESIGDAIATLHAKSRSIEKVGRLIDALGIELVFTAHPTEAKRRTVRNTLKRLRQDLIDLDTPDLLPRERDALLSRIKGDLACLWDTDALRPEKPTVMEEVQRGLFVLDPLWDTIPALYRNLRRALATYYPGHRLDPPVFLRFGSWIGGDRDGNPFVTAEVTQRTLRLLRQRTVEKHLDQCARLMAVLSISDQRHAVSAELIEGVERAASRWPDLAESIARANPHEKYRHFLRVIRHRLRATADADPYAPLPDAAYRSHHDLLDDLQRIADSLRDNAHHHLADGEVRDWIDRTRVFGLHFARLDIREDSRRLNAAVAEVMAALDRHPAYLDADESLKQSLLTQAPPDAPLDRGGLSDDARETLALFDLLQSTANTGAADALGVFIISMTHRPSDALAVLFLSRVSARSADAFVPPIVPLFETIRDLHHAHETLDQLLGCPPFADLVAQQGGRVTCMVGYSDSTKDGGYLSANVQLFSAQRRLAETAGRHGVELEVFHGRGGSLGRGGGPAARGILSLPADSITGKIRITEQGEVLAERYDDPQIALRHLEQVTWATLLITDRHTEPVDDPQWSETVDRAAETARRRYLAFKEDPAFLDFFSFATPIDSIESLPIGSRPARRRGARSLETLRAIPYTFAWTQNRSLLTGYYGLGAALHAAADGDWSRLQAMYDGWPFFRAVIDNAELALAKADPGIVALYTELIPDREAAARVLNLYRAEYDTARSAVLAVTRRGELLDGIPWLQHSIRVRNPYVDTINLVQVELMRRRAAAADLGENERQRLEDLLRVSVQGVAAGLRTTG